MLCVVRHSCSCLKIPLVLQGWYCIHMYVVSWIKRLPFTLLIINLSQIVKMVMLLKVFCARLNVIGNVMVCCTCCPVLNRFVGSAPTVSTLYDDVKLRSDSTGLFSL